MKLQVFKILLKYSGTSLIIIKGTILLPFDIWVFHFSLCRSESFKLAPNISSSILSITNGLNRFWKKEYDSFEIEIL